MDKPGPIERKLVNELKDALLAEHDKSIPSISKMRAAGLAGKLREQNGLGANLNLGMKSASTEATPRSGVGTPRSPAKARPSTPAEAAAAQVAKASQQADRQRKQKETYDTLCTQEERAMKMFADQDRVSAARAEAKANGLPMPAKVPMPLPVSTPTRGLSPASASTPRQRSPAPVATPSRLSPVPAAAEAAAQADAKPQTPRATSPRTPRSGQVAQVPLLRWDLTMTEPKESPAANRSVQLAEV